MGNNNTSALIPSDTVVKLCFLMVCLVLAPICVNAANLCAGLESVESCETQTQQASCQEGYFVGFINYPCVWNGVYCAQSEIPCSTTTTQSQTTSSTIQYYQIPDENYGTLPGLNNSGGSSVLNGTASNTSGMGKILDIPVIDFKVYIALFIVLTMLVSIKPFKLGAATSAIVLTFFAFVLPWANFTTSLILMYDFVAVSSWVSGGGDK